MPLVFVGHHVHEMEHVELTEGRHMKTNAFSVRFILWPKHMSEDEPEPARYTSL